AAAANADRWLDALHELYPDLQPAPDGTSAALGNLNMVLHPPISLANLGRLGETYAYYEQGVTAEVGALITALDQERIASARAAGYEVFECAATLERWYGYLGSIAVGSPLWRQVARNPAYRGVPAPLVLEHRFLIEDVPYGLWRVKEIGVRTGT